MQHSEFTIGGTFWCSGRQWRCTDIGTRTIAAIRIDRVDVGSNKPELLRTLNRAEAEAEGWFNGPPYAVLEYVFDEDGIVDCTLDAWSEVADMPGCVDDDAAASAEEALCITQARSLREHARAGGLRFEVYLPSDLADWMLGLVEAGVFTDPSEAVFVMLGEQHELESHADLRAELLRRTCQAALDDPRPGIPHEQVMKRMRQWLASPRPEPAVWRKQAL